MNHTCPTKCELCNEPATHANSVPDAMNSTEFHHAYRLMPLCWLHAVDAREDNCSRVVEVLPDGDVCRVDGGRASGDAVCECGAKFNRHPANATYPYLNQLCDGSLVKL